MRIQIIPQCDCILMLVDSSRTDPTFEIWEIAVKSPPDGGFVRGLVLLALALRYLYRWGILTSSALYSSKFLRANGNMCAHSVGMTPGVAADPTIASKLLSV